MATDETQRKIIDAAGPIFADKGYQAATVREICDAAGVGLASVNYHFRDKQHLYVRVVEEAHEYWTEHLSPLPEWTAEVPAAQRLYDWVLRVMQSCVFNQDETWHQRLLTVEVASPTEACHELLRDRFHKDVDVVFAILDEFVEPDVPDHHRYQLAFSIIGQCLFYDHNRELAWLLLGDISQTPAFMAEALARHITDVTLASLGAAPAITRPLSHPPVTETQPS